LKNKVTDMPTRPPVTDWASDFDHLDPAWVDNPYPIWDELQQNVRLLIPIGTWVYISFRGTRTRARSPSIPSISPGAAVSPFAKGGRQ
jgi:hypothetical protein